MRLALTAAVIAALALSGCGGEQLEADEVPGAPAALTLPPDEGLPTPAADADGDADATPTPTPTADASAGTTGGTTAAPAVTPAAPATGTTTTQAPTSTTGGAGADGNFEDFCAQNPGAC